MVGLGGEWLAQIGSRLIPLGVGLMEILVGVDIGDGGGGESGYIPGGGECSGGGGISFINESKNIVALSI